ncbi:MAG: hypothetical protein ACYSUP_18345, partial [Planctomycetota bacterium]
MTGVKDSRQEGFLTRMGAKWRYTNAAKPEQLVKNWAEANIGRPRAQVEAAIRDYDNLYTGGSPPPAVILWKTPPGLAVLDGVQRLCVLIDRRKVKEFSAYIVETDSATLATTIRLLANPMLQGHPEPVEWSKRQAVDMLVIEQGMSVEDLHDKSGWPIHELTRLRNILATGFQCRCAGAPNTLTDGVLLAVHECMKPDDLALAPKPIVEFLHDLKATKFNNGDSVPHIEAFFSDINRKKSAKPRHRQFEDRLARFHKDPEVIARLSGRRPSKQSVDIRL